MQALYQKAVKDIEAKKKTSVPWTTDEPYKQPYYSFSAEENKWIEVTPKSEETAETSNDLPSKICLYSWNVDFMLPHADARMHAALAQLASIVRPTRPSALTIMFLQEMLHSDLTILSSHPGIRAHFHMTDLTPEFWQSGHYGTVTFVDNRLPIADVFRVHYSDTKMERDALFVDVHHPASPKPIRFCNTHLESLVADPPLRPPQMKMAAQYMRDDSVRGSILAGDLNAIQPFDRTLHADNGLKDAYLELGGDDGDQAGHTWGQQAATGLRQQFGTSRMDKVFFCGDIALTGFDRFGADVVVEGQEAESDLAQLGIEQAWVTDHLGVSADFDVTGP